MKVAITNWVAEDPEQQPFRQAVHTILAAISGSARLQDNMVMKGGILMALVYNNARFTRDIDFSTTTRLENFDLAVFQASLERELLRAVEELGYGLDCIVQTCRQNPPGADKSFPTIEATIGYAHKGDLPSQRRLANKMAIQVVRVDYSLNEPIGDTELFEIETGKALRVYCLPDLIGEKFRALLQQEVRKRIRRQDVYDLYFLIENFAIAHEAAMKLRILQSSLTKAQARNLQIDRHSMRNPEIIRRSREEYDLLAAEVAGELPSFDRSYERVRAYYEGLPWDTEQQ